MSQKRDWVDYANLGSNLFQNLQLSGVQDKLSAMAFAGASEQAKAAEEDHLREGVFEAETLLRKMGAYSDKHRAGKLALALVTLGNFERFGVTSAKFRSFPDKEKFRSVTDGFKALVTECEAALSAEEKADAQACAKFMLEPDINAFVPASFATRLAEAEQQAGELDQKKVAATASPFASHAVACVALACIGFVAYIIGVGTAGANPYWRERGEIIVEISLALIALSALIPCILWSLNRKAKRDPERIKLVDQITKLLDLKRDEVRALKEELEAERQRIAHRRAAIMAKVLKQHSDVALRDTKPLKTNVV